MKTFAEATAVSAQSSHDAGPTFYVAAEIAEGWDILGNANGGYLLAIAGRALTTALGRPDVISMTTHYLRPAQPGPVEIQITELKSGKRFSTGHLVMRNANTHETIIASIGTVGDLSAPVTGADAEAAAFQLVESTPPDLPDPDDCFQTSDEGEQYVPPFFSQVDVRFHPDDAGFMQGAPTGTPRLRGWFRLRDGGDMKIAASTLPLLVAVDAFPPTIFNSTDIRGWSPTLELTAHLRGKPVPGWIACEVKTRFVTNGFLEVDGEFWDESGQLVAQSRQLALAPRGS